MANTVPPLSELLQMMRRQRNNAQLALFVGAHLEDAGRIEEAVALWSLGDDINPAVRHVKDQPNAHQMMRQHSRRADAAMCLFFTELHERAISDFAKEAGDDVSRVKNAIWSMTHAEPFEFITPMQKPVVFYMPDLPAISVQRRDQLTWPKLVESAFQDILQEYQSRASDLKLMQPYVPSGTVGAEWQKLSGTLDWSAIYLFKDSQPTTTVKLFPKTQAVLEKIDLVQVNGVPMEVFFSRLKPGAHIPPHYGLTNSRMTVHLPLIVPEDCAIRVGKHEYGWKEGKIIAFDDSFEHEAWNRSDSERVVLIFEVHNPDLSDMERRAIERGYGARQDWLDKRTAILGWR